MPLVTLPHDHNTPLRGRVGGEKPQTRASNNGIQGGRVGRERKMRRGLALRPLPGAEHIHDFFFQFAFCAAALGSAKGTQRYHRGEGGAMHMLDSRPVGQTPGGRKRNAQGKGVRAVHAVWFRSHHKGVRGWSSD